MSKMTNLCLAFVVLTILCGCSATKFVPEDEYMLEDVKIKSSDKDFNVAHLKGFIRQHPNSKWFSLVKVPLAPYALSGKDTTKRINRFLQRVGESPVIFDTVQAKRTEENILLAVRNQGWLDATVEQNKNIKGKKIKVTYLVEPNRRYNIRHISYNIPDTALAEYIVNSNTKSLLRSGMPFDLNVLEEERSRISRLLQNNGYYKFNKEYVRFVADTCVGNHQVDLEMVVPLFQANEISVPVPHKQYKIASVSYVSDIPLSDLNARVHELDSVHHKGAPIYYSKKLSFRPSVFTNNNAIKVGDLYKENAQQRTYSNYGQLGAVMFSNIMMVERDTASKDLDCLIALHQNKKRSFGAELEGTNSAGDLGAALSLTYQNRNIFKGSEQFFMEFRGAFEAITGLEGYADQNYLEFSVEAGLTFPNFKLFRFKDKEGRVMRSTTELSLLYDTQNRPEFHRRVLTGSLRYRWYSLNNLFRHRIDLLDLNYVFMPWISDTFRKDYLEDKSNRNAILRYNYENLFIMRLGYSFTYNSQRNLTTNNNYGTNALSIRFNIETAGNLLNAGSLLFDAQKNENNQYSLFNIAYAQYLKGDIDISKSVRFDSRNSLGLHFGLGVAYPYGNSTILPYEKRYFSGGANSVRGWSVRELGPGRFMGSDGRIDFINQTGDIKLDLSVEYRTFLFWKLHGAAFIDAGNIWTIREYAEQPGGQFRFKSFWREIAVSYGLGIRLNFDYFILRLDGGMKAVHPGYTDSRRHFPIIHPDFKRDFTFHFAVGLPF